MKMDEKLRNDIIIRKLNMQYIMRKAGINGLMLTTDVNIYYMTGRVFSGYYYLPADDEPVCFVKRPVDFSGDRTFIIRKPEQLPELFASIGCPLPAQALLETDVMSYNECMRLQNIFHFQTIGNASAYLRKVRMLKSPYEIEQVRLSAKRHSELYAKISSCYRQGMTDLKFQAAIEYQMRMLGSRGVFRAYGLNHIFMGSLLAGENAAKPAPFDFALGGAGQTPFCPIGANGTLLREGMAIMVDMAGNFTDYLSDMTRVFALGPLPAVAIRAHQMSLDIQQAIEEVAKPGVACAELYHLAFSMVEKAGLTEYFMGTQQQAKFIGHGLGLEINEPPVLAPRSTETLEQNVTFALEPKFVIPQVGAVGIENSYLVTATGIEKLTRFEENIIQLKIEN